MTEVELKTEIKKLIKTIRYEVINIKQFFDDSEKFTNYLYYLHGLFSKLETTMIKLERLEDRHE